MAGSNEIVDTKQEQPEIEIQILKSLFELIANGNLILHRNLRNEPFVKLRVPNFSHLERQLFHRDVLEWLSFYSWRTFEVVLHRYQINRILNVLAGQSFSMRRINIDENAKLACLENDPVIAVLFEFMFEQKRFETQMKKLWQVLDKFAKERDLLKVGGTRFPRGPQILSKKLRQLKPILEQLDIKVTITRSNGSQVVLEYLVDDANHPPSVNRPASNPSSSIDLDHSDDQNLMEMLRNRRNQQGQ